MKDKYLKNASKKLRGNLYAIDDNSAIVCVNNKIEVVSEGKWKKY